MSAMIDDVLNNFQHPFQGMFRTNSWDNAEKQSLSWIQPKLLQGNYLLQAKDQVFGALKYEEKQQIRWATAQTDADHWHFKFTRIVLPTVTISRGNEFVASIILETFPPAKWRP